MIASDWDAIRESIKALNKKKEADANECRRKAMLDGITGPKPLPEQKPLFNEPGPPHFRGFFVEGLEPPVRSPRDSNFCLDEYEQAWDEWDDATLDSGVTAETASLFMWGKLD